MTDDDVDDNNHGSARCCCFCRLSQCPECLRVAILFGGRGFARVVIDICYLARLARGGAKL